MPCFARFSRILYASCFAWFFALFSFNAFADVTILHWTSNTSDGTVVGVARCGPKSGATNTSEKNWVSSNWSNQGTNSGAGCFCRAQDVNDLKNTDAVSSTWNDVNGTQIVSYWHGLGTGGDTFTNSTCLANCASSCAQRFADNSSYKEALCGGTCAVSSDDVVSNCTSPSPYSENMISDIYIIENATAMRCLWDSQDPSSETIAQESDILNCIQEFGDDVKHHIGNSDNPIKFDDLLSNYTDTLIKISEVNFQTYDDYKCYIAPYHPVGTDDLDFTHLFSVINRDTFDKTVDEISAFINSNSSQFVREIDTDEEYCATESKALRVFCFPMAVFDNNTGEWVDAVDPDEYSNENYDLQNFIDTSTNTPLSELMLYPTCAEEANISVNQAGEIITSDTLFMLALMRNSENDSGNNFASSRVIPIAYTNSHGSLTDLYDYYETQQGEALIPPAVREYIENVIRPEFNTYGQMTNTFNDCASAQGSSYKDWMIGKSSSPSASMSNLYLSDYFDDGSMNTFYTCLFERYISQLNGSSEQQKPMLTLIPITQNGTSFGCNVPTCSCDNTDINHDCDPSNNCSTSPGKYTITLNANGGTGGTSAIKEVYNTRWTNTNNSEISSITTPVKEHATFTGYYTMQTGGTQIINAQGTIIASPDTFYYTQSGDNIVFSPTDTLYAHYDCATGYNLNNNTGVCDANTNTPYTVCHYTKGIGETVYTLNGGVCDSKTGTTDATVILANEIKNIGNFVYTEGFAGTAATGTTKPDSGAATTTTILANGSRVISLYYSKDSYSITFNMNGGSFPIGVVEPQTYSADSDFPIYLPTPILARHTFDGWCDDPNLTVNCATGRSITSGSTGNKNFYAKWTLSSCDAGYYLQNNACNECPANSTSSAGSSVCTCNTGFSTSSNQTTTTTEPCQKVCSIGQYFDGTSCTSCPSGFTTADAFASSINECITITGYILNPNVDKDVTGTYTYIKDGSGYSEQPEFSSAPSNSWKVFYSYGNLVGRAACSDIWADYASVSDVNFTPDTWYGQNCWCGIKQFGSCNSSNRTNCTDDNLQNVTAKWVSFGYVQDDRCWQDCAGKCANAIEQNSTFRNSALSNISFAAEPCPAGSYCSTANTPISYGDVVYSPVTQCPEPYTESEPGTTEQSNCYQTWACPASPSCPEHTINCAYVGATSGTDYYGSETTHCQTTYDCEPGYVPVSNNPLTTKDTSIDGDEYGFNNDSNGAMGHDYVGIDTYNLGEQMWAAEFSYGTVRGNASCNNISGDNNYDEWDNDSSNWTASYNAMSKSDTGSQCWCQLVDFTDSQDNSVYTINNAQWVYFSFIEAKTNQDCAHDCAFFCSAGIQDDYKFRNAMFGLDSTPSCVLKDYTIVYDNAGGTGCNNETYTGTTTICTPTRDGYQFDGWIDVNTTEVYDGGDSVTNTDLNLEAQWSQLYTITYNLGGGTGCTNQTFTNTATVCSDPTRNGYTFDGWSTTNGGEMEYIGDEVITKANLTLYARWEPITYTITYVSNGGTEYSQINYTADSGTITLPSPTREHYDFNGWYDNDQFTGDAITQVPSGSYGNKTFYAQWTANETMLNYYFYCDSSYAVELSDGQDFASNGLTFPSDLSSCPQNDSYTATGWICENIDDSSETVEFVNMESTAWPEDFYNVECYPRWSEPVEPGIWDCVNGIVSSNADSYTDEEKTNLPTAEYLQQDVLTYISGSSTYALSDQSMIEDYLEGEDFYVTWGDTTIRGWGGCSANSWGKSSKPKYSDQTEFLYTYAGCGCSLDKERWVVYGNLFLNTQSDWESRNTYCRQNCPRVCAEAVATDQTFRDALFNGVCPTPVEVVPPVECEQGQFLDGNTCVDSCGNKFAYDGVCYTTCPTNTFAKDGVCVSECGDGKMGINGICEDSKFEFVTTADTSNFTFTISAAGTYYIDWGDGTVETKNLSSATATAMSHSWSSAGAHRVKITGEAEAYSTANITPAIGFGNIDGQTNTAENLAEIYGSLGAIFPTIGSGDSWSTQPRFYRTFHQCINLESEIPVDLFKGIDGEPVSYMFFATFMECPLLSGTIPPHLFNGISGKPGAYTFDGTFSKCSSLTGTIPSTIFENIYGDLDGSENFVFAGTFWSCSGLEGTIPENLFSGIRGAPTNKMFDSTFYGCSGLTGTLPQHLFDTISGPLAQDAFSRTFGATTNLESFVPVDFFKNITNADNIDNGMTDIFDESGILTLCPEGFYKHNTIFDSFWSGRVSCDPCPQGLTSPEGSLDESACHVQNWDCDAGKYLNTEPATPFCDTCPEDYYCPNGSWTVDTAEHSKTSCPLTHPNSNEGAVNKYDCYASVTFVFNDGDNDDVINHIPFVDSTASGYTVELPNATRDGYTFDGWFDSNNNLVTNETVFSNGDVVLHAKWTSDAFVCESGVWMHIGDNTRACLSTEKTTSPAMAVQIGNTKYYLNTSLDTDKKINEESSMKMHIYYRGQEYNIHDASVTRE